MAGPESSAATTDHGLARVTVAVSGWPCDSGTGLQVLSRN